MCETKAIRDVHIFDHNVLNVQISVGVVEHHHTSSLSYARMKKMLERIRDAKKTRFLTVYLMPHFSSIFHYQKKGQSSWYAYVHIYDIAEYIVTRNFIAILKYLKCRKL